MKRQVCLLLFWFFRKHHIKLWLLQLVFEVLMHFVLSHYLLSLVCQFHYKSHNSHIQSKFNHTNRIKGDAVFRIQHQEFLFSRISGTPFLISQNHSLSPLSALTDSWTKLAIDKAIANHTSVRFIKGGWGRTMPCNRLC